ncbi:hypothetical protein DHX103_08680 [Planococcus sp. X10-3]|uniref:hypothetical protein n=1 Tax=Planococcus sp. X10-3 TaxID=3061240 RepID=UPI003BB03095
MDQDQDERKEFLQQQLQWTKGQIDILDQMDVKLQEMKGIAESAAGNDLSMDERESLNRRLEILKDEYDTLEKQKLIVFH